MKAGIDCGLALAKAVWMKEGNLNFASTAEKPLETILNEMKNDGIKKLNAAGLGYWRMKGKLSDFEVDSGPIKKEIALQADGARMLLEADGIKLEDFLLVSVGNRVLHTKVAKDSANFILINDHGGGYLMGMCNAFGFYNYEKFSKLASKGKSLNLKMKDLFPEKKGIEGEFIIAALGKLGKEYENEDLNTSLVEDVAMGIIWDILVMSNQFEINNSVYIGSTIKYTPLLKDFLSSYSVMIGKNAYFPSNGEFALALGAYNLEHKAAGKSG